MVRVDERLARVLWSIEQAWAPPSAQGWKRPPWGVALGTLASLRNLGLVEVMPPGAGQVLVRLTPEGRDALRAGAIPLQRSA